MKQYLDTCEYVLKNGSERGDRTGTGTISVFGYQNRFDLSEGFPLITSKKIFIPGFVHELLWFLKGDTNIKYLLDNNVRIWNEWANHNGDLGPVYGKQWRSWPTSNGGTIDQITQVISDIKNKPESRRLIVNAWNPEYLPEEGVAHSVNVENGKMALPPCHLLFQFYVTNDRKLSCQLYQRSADLFLGVPFNIASYSLLTHMIAKICGLGVGEFVHTFGDLHIYKDHIEKIKLQMSRDPRPLPKLVIQDRSQSIDEFISDDFSFEGYDPHPLIKGAVSA